MIDIRGIQGKLKQRYPFLLVDRVIECEELKHVTAVKNVTINEPYFMGHFQGNPIMPGVLIIEAMAQAGAFLFPTSEIGYLVEVNKTKFRRFITPGDVMVMKATFKNKFANYAEANIKTYVEDKLVAMCDIRYYLSD